MAGAGTVWLVGMMGAGKSSVGRRIAQRRGSAFVDTDEEIERVAGFSAAELFAREGEAGFRERERAVVRRLADAGGVVALGGGALGSAGTRAVVRGRGVVVYLRARTETLLARLGDCATRPLLAGLTPARRAQRLAELLAERRAHYESADVVVDTDALAPEAVADAVLAALEGRVGAAPA